MQYQISPPPMNPLSRLLAAVVGAVALIGTFFFGFFVLIAAVVFGLIAWLVIWLRIWWFKRKLAASGEMPPGFGQSSKGSGGQTANRDDVIDAEYEVVSRKEDAE